jgi:aldehyde:ferredoxin oxidoreductase
MKSFGWTGKILRVDLERQKILKEESKLELRFNYLGQRGANSKILYDEVGPEVDPLGPENELIFGVGPLSGTATPCASRFTVTAKSPLTGILGDANSGGFFGPEMKFAGYDHIVIKGRASEPVYLWIDDDEVEIRGAGQIWGKTTWEADEILKEEHGDDIQVACIGPAGEHLVRYSCIINNMGRAAGRTGMGAVMGSKHLKAIAVRGTKSVDIANYDKYIQAREKILSRIYEDPLYDNLSYYGTLMLTERANEQGWLPTYNNQTLEFEGCERLFGDYLIDKYQKRKKGCFQCPIHCSRFYESKEDPEVCGEGPEYEGVDNLGPRLGISDPFSVLKMNTLCNKLGIDVISFGHAVSWAMECYQRGLLTEQDTGGIPLRWGDHETVIRLLNMIVRREGFGNLLAEGAWRASKKIGRGTEEYVMHTKGLTHPAADPRGKISYGLGYAVASRGGDHLRAHPAPEYLLTADQAEKMFGTRELADRLGTKGKAGLVVWTENLLAVVNSVGLCEFPSVMILVNWFDEIAELLSAVTGWDVKGKDLSLIGERIVNLERLYNARLGITRKDDTLPKRLTHEPSPARGSKGSVVPLEKMLDEYYQLRGWDREKGLPTLEKLKELGLNGGSQKEGS